MFNILKERSSMRKIIYTAMLAGGMLMATSCVDLTQEPQSFVTEEDYIALMDLEGFEKAVSGLYTDLWQGNYGFNCRMQILSLGGDDIMHSPTKANNAHGYMDNLSPSLSINAANFTTSWEYFFKVINNANKLINNVGIPEGDLKAKYQEALGEAYFMRGYAYFCLARLYGDLPLILNLADADGQMPRTPVAEIYSEAIVPSLEEAIKLLPSKSRSGFSNTASKWAAKACLAEVYITMAGWPLKKGQEYYSKAAEVAKDIIDNSGLKLTAKYEDLWKEAKKTEANEHMFAIHHDAKQKSASNYGKSYYPKDYIPAGWADYYSEEKFYLDYPDGARKDWNFMTEWLTGTAANSKLTHYSESTDGLPAISKYYDYDNGAPAASAQSNGITSIYRYADVLLIYAEASVKATNTVNATAAKALKDIQERAGSSVITNTTDPVAFEKAVFDEYGWEFFAEMRRWFQIVRLEKVAEVNPTKWNNSLFQVNNHYLMPIPENSVLLTGWKNNAGY